MISDFGQSELKSEVCRITGSSIKSVFQSLFSLF